MCADAFCVCADDLVAKEGYYSRLVSRQTFATWSVLGAIIAPTAVFRFALWSIVWTARRMSPLESCMPSQLEADVSWCALGTTLCQLSERRTRKWMSEGWWAPSTSNHLSEHIQYVFLHALCSTLWQLAESCQLNAGWCYESTEYMNCTRTRISNWQTNEVAQTLTTTTKDQGKTERRAARCGESRTHTA